jgi:flagellar biosynthesis/type III secretory pathway protein FliH
MLPDGHLLLFADDFAIVAAPPEAEPMVEEPPPPPRSYDQDELDAACAVARAEGHAAGSEAATADAASGVAGTIGRIGELFADAAANAARVAEESADAVSKLLLASLLAGYPLLRERHGADELRSVMRRLLPGLLKETQVTFHVHPSMVEVVTAELASVPLRERQHMSFEPSEEIPPGDARITWPDGRAIRDTAKVQAAIADILGPLGLLPEPAPAGSEPEAR